jgi:broad specificity phosphatase PhoE
MRRTIYLFRHGEVEDAYKDRFRGCTDCKLGPEGVEMSVRNLRFLAENGVRTIITSGLRRTDFVGERLARFGAAHHVDTGFQEIHLGDWEGQRIDDIKRSHPDLIQRFFGGDLDIVIPGGTETPRQARQRSVDAWNRRLAEHHDHDLAIIAHGGVLAYLLSHLKNAPAVFHHDLGSMTEILIDGDTATVVRENVMVH